MPDFGTVEVEITAKVTKVVATVELYCGEHNVGTKLVDLTPVGLTDEVEVHQPAGGTPVGK